MQAASNAEEAVMDLDVLVAVSQLAAGQTRMEMSLMDIKQAVHQKEAAPSVDASAEIVDMDVLMAVNRLQEGQGRVEGLLAGIQQELASLPERLGAACRPASARQARQTHHERASHDSHFNSSNGEVHGSFWVGDVGFFTPGMNDEAEIGRQWSGRPSVAGGSDFLEDWPTTVVMRPGYEGPRGTFTARSHTASSSADLVQSTRSNRKGDSMKGGVASRWRRFTSGRLVAHPNSTFRSMWNLVSVTMLLHDMTVVPVLLAWNLQIEGWMLAIAWASCIFWTVDVTLSFMTGYTIGGRLEMRLSRIARRYIATWFLPEMLIVMNDWLNLLLDTGSGFSSAGSLRILRFTKCLKLLRVIGALRVMKISRLVKDMMERRLSGLTVLVQCVLASCFALWLSHILGCIWFGVGRLAPTDTKARWIEMASERQGSVVPFMEETLVYQYATAVHWAFAQFTLGAIEIVCTNSWERLFNVLCLLIGLTFGSTIVSSLSASMVDYQMRILDKTDKMRRLTRFLRENRVCHNTTLQVQQQAVERLNMEERLKEDDVAVLKLLSKSLRLELRHEIFGTYLNTHPLFHLWSKLDKEFIQRLCSQAAEFIFPRQLDEIFVAGTCTDKMYYLVSGTLEYHQDGELIPLPADAEPPKPEAVQEGTWLAEASLWTHWMHVGTCKAVTIGHVLMLDAEEVVKICHRRGAVREVASDYCRIFFRRIHASKPPHLCYPNDLMVPNTEFSDMLVDMDVQVRTRIGILALEHLQKDFFKIRRKEDMDQLADEVGRGRSFLYLDVTGQIERVVHKVVARIIRSDGRVFVRVAKSNDGKRIDGSCKLPRCAAEQGETPNEAYERLVASMGWSTNDMSDSSSEDDVVVKESRKFKLHTKCLIRATSSIVHADVQLPIVATGGPKATSIHSNMTASTVLRSSRSSGSAGVESMPASALPSMQFMATESTSNSRFYKAEHPDYPNRLCFYTWIPVGKFNYWSSPIGRKDLHEWLSSIRLSL